MNESVLTKILLVVGLVVVVGLLAAHDTEDEHKDPKYDLSVKPGAVTYGTHSSAVVPIQSAPTHHSIPMVSGGAVRSYAHYGHSSASAVSSGKGLYTTSSATVHTIGSGGGGGGASGGGSSSSSASSGIQYGGGFAAVSMPSLAFTPSTRSATTAEMATTTTTTEMAAISMRMNAGARRSRPDYTGTGGEEVEKDGETWYWDEEEEDWVNKTPVGTVREWGGYYEEWDGYTWVRKGQIPDLGTPVGDAPWWLIALLLMAYGVVRVVTRKRTTAEK